MQEYRSFYNMTVFSFYILVAILTVVLLQSFKQDAISEYKERQNLELSQKFHTELEALIQEKQEATLAMAVSLAQDSKFKEALKKNDSKILNLDEISRSYSLNTVYKNVWIQLIDKEGKSFARSWTDEHGDDLYSIRKDVRDIVREKKLHSTLSVGKYTLSFKSMVPVFDKDEFLGILEIITHFNSIEKRLEAHGYDTITFADKKYQQNLTRSITNYFVEGYYLVSFQENQKLLNYIVKEGIENILNRENDYSVYDQSHILIRHTFYNNSNEPLGYVVVVTKNNILPTTINSLRITYTLFIFIVLALATFIFYMLLDKKVIARSLFSIKYNNRLVMLLLSLFIAVVSVSFFLLFLEQKQKKQEFLDSYTAEKIHEYRHVYQKYKDLATLFFKTKIDSDSIKEILSIKDKDEVRKKLYEELASVYDQLLVYNLKQLHFHTPDNKSLLRFHRPQKYGDDLSKTRQTVVYVNKNKEMIDGFEEGKIYNGFRFVYPLYRNNTYLGSVEISFSALSMLEEYVNSFEVKAAFLIKKELVESKVMPDEHKNYIQSPLQNYFFDKQVNDLLRINNANINFCNKYPRLISQIESEVKKDIAFSLYFCDEKTVVSFLPIANPVSKENVAFLAVSSKNSFLHDKELSTNTILFAVIFMVALLALFVYRELISKKNLEELNEQLNNAQKVASIGNWTLNLIDNRLYWSDEIFNIFEIDKARFGASYEAFLEAIHPEDREEVAKAYEDSLVTKESYSIEHRLLFADGRLKYVKEHCMTSYDYKGNPLYSTGTVQDITQQKEIENALREANDKAQNALAAKSQFLANMSHEIRTPMNAIVGLGKLLEEMPLGLKQRDMIGKINSSSVLLLGIINDILDYSKIEAGKLELESQSFNLKQTLSQLKAIFAHTAKEKELELSFDYASILPSYVIGDQLRLQQVLMNLLSNALKFTHQGSVRLSVKLLSPTKESPATLLFEIIDTGIGIDKKQIAQLFEPFMQADVSTTRQFGGTGLGLVITKNILEGMGTHITLKSTPNQGSVFSFKLTLDVDEWDAKEEDSSSLQYNEIQEIELLEGLSILLVEDNEINQEVASMMLTNVGIKVDIANNGQEGVKLYQDDPKRYDGILMDLQMPVMSGYEAANKIREFDTDVPIIALTAAAMVEDKQKVLDAGMNDHIGKPIDKEELYRVLLYHLAKERELTSKRTKDLVEEKPTQKALGGEVNFAQLKEKLQSGTMIDEQEKERLFHAFESLVPQESLQRFLEAIEEFDYDHAVKEMQQWKL